jgi:hypothetical protein
MSNFNYWTMDKLRERFGLKRVYKYSLLSKWLQSTAQIEEDERNMLSRWRESIEK